MESDTETKLKFIGPNWIWGRQSEQNIKYIDLFYSWTTLQCLKLFQLYNSLCKEHTYNTRRCFRLEIISINFFAFDLFNSTSLESICVTAKPKPSRRTSRRTRPSEQILGKFLRRTISSAWNFLLLLLPLSSFSRIYCAVPPKITLILRCHAWGNKQRASDACRWDKYMTNTCSILLSTQLIASSSKYGNWSSMGAISWRSRSADSFQAREEKDRTFTGRSKSMNNFKSCAVIYPLHTW